MSRLAQQVQALPSELYNAIFELTLTADEEIIPINEIDAPPHLRQVNHRSRILFARQYYQQCTLVGQDGPGAHFVEWTRTLSNDNLDDHLNVRYRMKIDKKSVTSTQTQLKHQIMQL